jgi:hypothetical protein
MVEWLACDRAAQQEQELHAEGMYVAAVSLHALCQGPQEAAAVAAILYVWAGRLTCFALLLLLPCCQVWDLAQGTCVQTVMRAHDSAITSILRWESVSTHLIVKYH